MQFLRGPKIGSNRCARFVEVARVVEVVKVVEVVEVVGFVGVVGVVGVVEVSGLSGLSEQLFHEILIFFFFLFGNFGKWEQQFKTLQGIAKTVQCCTLSVLSPLLMS